MEPIKIKAEECDRNIRTYGDVIRHMNNDELALFLHEMQANVEAGLLAILRAKSWPHRHGGQESRMEKRSYDSMYGFMNGRITDEEADFADIWGVENWQDLCQWEWKGKKNFGMDIVY